jgi:hypothetical protein
MRHWKIASRNPENKVYLFLPNRLAIFHSRALRKSSRKPGNNNLLFREIDLQSADSRIRENASHGLRKMLEIRKKENSIFIRFNRVCDWIKCSLALY